MQAKLQGGHISSQMKSPETHLVCLVGFNGLVWRYSSQSGTVLANHTEFFFLGEKDSKFTNFHLKIKSCVERTYLTL